MQIEKTMIGLYSRKSKYTEKGLSIQNQIDECRDYIRRNFEEGTYEVKIYQDEGISGKDFERPEMQRLLEDIAADQVDVLVCYRLDRVSRSVRDFSRLIDDLQDKGKEFISVKESFDTRTPIGRA
ncbi:MAG: recombinase family protein, partial [Lachnospiraceae bacterium]|nr:recombinase family protein [Lachnospiraceae bacterium]